MIQFLQNTMVLRQDLTLILSCWFLLFLWQLIAVPWLYRIFRRSLVVAGWGLGRVLTWLALALPIWFLGHLGLPVNQAQVIYILFFGLAAYAFYYGLNHWQDLLQYFRPRLNLILTQEALFFTFFVFLCLVRAFKPDINGLEKFMDAGLIQAYLKSPTLPIQDMWLAGSKINYYTFGHFLGSVVTNYWGVSLAYSYNLILGLIMGLVATEAFVVSINLAQALFEGREELNEHENQVSSQSEQFNHEQLVSSPQRSWQLIKVGLLAAFLLVLAGNGHTIWHLLSNFNFEGYWYPDATRFIERTIHEFPAYSFIVSDLHAHVWAMPLVLLTLVMILLWLRKLVGSDELSSEESAFKSLQELLAKQYIWWSVVVGVLLGILMMTSTWDLLIYSLLLAVLGVVLLLINKQFFWPLFASAAVMIMTLIITASPWWLNFISISEGVRLADEHSPLWQLLVLWTPHVTVSSLALAFAVSLLKRLLPFFTQQAVERQEATECKEHKNNEDEARQAQQSCCALTQLSTKMTMISLVIAMVVTAGLLLLLPEIIYMKDIYPNHPRANTMFKLTFQAFIIMGLVASWFAALLQLKEKFETKLHLLLRVVLALFILSVGLYPYFGYRDFYHQLKFKHYQGLNGLTWFKARYPNDYAALRWLQQHVEGRPVILEAVGESYTEFARVSTFSGLPTVLGWRVHEWLWRGSFDQPQERTEQVKTVFEQPQSQSAQAVLKQFQVKYIFIGSKEREAYAKLDLVGLLNLGEIVFKEGDTYIVAFN